MGVRWVEIFQFAVNSLEDGFDGTAVKIVDGLELQVQVAVMTRFVARFDVKIDEVISAQRVNRCLGLPFIVGVV